MPTWGCEKACGPGIKPCFYSSGYFNKTLSSRVLVIQALLCTTADKGEPENLRWVSALYPTQDRNANQDRLLARDASPWTSLNNLRKVHLRVSGIFAFEAVGLWKGRTAVGSGCRGRSSRGQPVPWLAITRRGASVSSDWAPDQRKGPKRKTMSKPFQMSTGPGVTSSYMRNFISAICKSYWISLEELGQRRTLKNSPAGWLRTECRESPGTELPRMKGWREGPREEWQQRVDESKKNHGVMNHIPTGGEERSPACFWGKPV